MINAYMQDNLIIKSTTYDVWGVPTYTENSAKGYFTFKTKLVRNQAGEQVVSSANVMLPVMTLGHQDKIVYDGNCLYRSAYNALTSYAINDAVSYNGVVYKALKASLGIAVSNAEYWVVMKVYSILSIELKKDFSNRFLLIYLA
jgi:hypothetical protein